MFVEAVKEELIKEQTKCLHLLVTCNHTLSRSQLPLGESSQ